MWAGSDNAPIFPREDAHGYTFPHAAIRARKRTHAHLSAETLRSRKIGALSDPNLKTVNGTCSASNPNRGQWSVVEFDQPTSSSLARHH